MCDFVYLYLYCENVKGCACVVTHVRSCEWVFVGASVYVCVCAYASFF